MYFYLRIHEDELSKTHRFKTYNNSLLTSEVLAVAIFGCNMNFNHVSPRDSQFRPFFFFKILLSVLSRHSNHHWDCEIWDPDSCLTEETSPVACGSVSLGYRFSTFQNIAAKVTASRPGRLASSPLRLFLLTFCQPAPLKLISYFLYYLMSLYQLQIWQTPEFYGRITMSVEQTIILKALVTYLK
jgi:hypothetical protein